jgi:hypothetical protein
MLGTAVFRLSNTSLNGKRMGCGTYILHWCRLSVFALNPVTMFESILTLLANRWRTRHCDCDQLVAFVRRFSTLQGRRRPVARLRSRSRHRYHGDSCDLPGALKSPCAHH